MENDQTIITNGTHSTLETRTSEAEQAVVQSLTEPGAYVCNWSGHLIRAAPDAFGPNLHALSLVAHGRLSFTKICNDPYVSLTRARMLAANADLHVSF